MLHAEVSRPTKRTKTLPEGETTQQKHSKRKEVTRAMQCRLCNESFEQVDIDFGEVVRLGDEYWHVECYAEYFDEALETA